MKKISRKDIADMSASQFMDAARGPYKQLFRYILPYKSRFFLALLFGALYGLVNGAMVWTLKFVGDRVFGAKASVKDLDLMVAKLPPEQVEATQGAVAQITEAFQTSFPSADERLLGPVLLAGIAIPVIMLMRGLFGYLNSYCMMWVSVRVLSDIRTKLFRRLMGQSLEFFNKQKSGELIQTVFNQTRMAQSALTQIASDAIKQPISILAAIAVLFWIDWKFSLAALVLFPLCIIPVLIVGKKVRKSAGNEETEAGSLMVIMSEAFAGIRVVKSHAREDYELERFLDSNDKMMRSLMRWQKAVELVGPLVETVASFGIALALIYVYMAELSAGTFLALQGGLVLLYPPSKALSRIHILMQKCLAATTKVFELMEREPNIKEKENAIVLGGCQGDIRYENLTFSYGKKVAVEGISLHIAPGQTCALVGQSGAGKSTLLSLLMRFYDPQEGSVRIDGHDIRDLTVGSLRDNIGIVNQDNFLFHDSIYENIRYGRLDATREEIEHAATLAHAHEFILEQDNGYETVIGDKGCSLSGGQQQRLCIARAILRNAPILLLDEAYSALDSESEKKIQDAVDTLAAGKTVIAIAHRLSTILKADQIVVMQEGRIHDVGTHAELLGKSDIYRQLYHMQFSHAHAMAPVG